MAGGQELKNEGPPSGGVMGDFHWLSGAGPSAAGNNSVNGRLGEPSLPISGDSVWRLADGNDMKAEPHGDRRVRGRA